MCDIDLLVRKSDMKWAKECLIRQGYEFKSGSTFFDEDAYERKHFHFPYVKHSLIASTVVELHQDIASKSAFIKNNILEFWENALPINNGHKCILSVPKELLLLHIFWHTYLNISESLYIRLIWLLDIAFIIQKHKDDINWLFIEKKAKEWEIHRQVYFCLYLTTQLFSIAFDKKIMRTLMPSNHSAKIFNFVILKIENDMQAFKDSNRIYILLLNFVSMNSIYKGTKYFFRYCFKNLTRNREWIRQRYKITSKKGIYFFYFIHPIILILDSLKWTYKIFWANNRGKPKV